MAKNQTTFQAPFRSPIAVFPWTLKTAYGAENALQFNEIVEDGITVYLLNYTLGNSSSCQFNILIKIGFAQITFEWIMQLRLSFPMLPNIFDFTMVCIQPLLLN